MEINERKCTRYGQTIFFEASKVCCCSFYPALSPPLLALRFLAFHLSAPGFAEKHLGIMNCERNGFEVCSKFVLNFKYDIWSLFEVCLKLQMVHSKFQIETLNIIRSFNCDFPNFESKL